MAVNINEVVYVYFETEQEGHEIDNYIKRYFSTGVFKIESSQDSSGHYYFTCICKTSTVAFNLGWNAALIRAKHHFNKLTDGNNN